MAPPIRILLSTAVLHLCTALSGNLRNREDLLQEFSPSASVHMLTPWGAAGIDSQAGCEDAAEGSSCFNAIMWLKKGGFNRYPSRYPGYKAESLFQDVQAMLNSSGKAHCPKPCAMTGGMPLQDAVTVSREGPSGIKAKGPGHRLPGSNCHDAEKG